MNPSTPSNFDDYIFGISDTIEVHFAGLAFSSSISTVVPRIQSVNILLERSIFRVIKLSSIEFKCYFHPSTEI